SYFGRLSLIVRAHVGFAPTPWAAWTRLLRDSQAQLFALEERPSVTPVRMVRSALSRACVKIIYCAQHPERRHRRRRNTTFQAWLSSPFVLLDAGRRAGRSYRITAEDLPSML